MPRVLITSNGLRAVYNFRRELIIKLISDGYDVHVTAPVDEFAPMLESLGAKVHHVDVDRRNTNPIKDFKLILDFYKVIKNVKPDIVLNYTAKGICYAGMICGFLKIPFTNYIEGVGTTFTGSGIKSKIIKTLFYLGCKKASRVVFMNDDNYEFFKKNRILTHTRFEFITSTGIDLDMFSAVPYPQSENISFVFISRILKEKGIDIYLDVAKFIKNKYPNTTFNVVGEIEEQKEYESILSDLHDKNVIVYHGLLKDVRSVIESSHCLLFPTYYGEGRNVVIQETSAMARPFITSNITGCKESCVENVNGFLVTPKDTYGFIRACENFINMPYEEKVAMGQNARKIAENDMDRQKYVGIWAELIKTILTEK